MLKWLVAVLSTPTSRPRASYPIVLNVQGKLVHSKCFYMDDTIPNSFYDIDDVMIVRHKSHACNMHPGPYVVVTDVVPAKFVAETELSEVTLGRVEPVLKKLDGVK